MRWVRLSKNPQFALQHRVKVIPLADRVRLLRREEEPLQPARNLLRLVTTLAALMIAGRVVSPRRAVRVSRSVWFKDATCAQAGRRRLSVGYDGAGACLFQHAQRVLLASGLDDPG
jgi:hypothetical protein